MDNQAISELDIIYNIKGEYINLFGPNFVKNNINMYIRY